MSAIAILALGAGYCGVVAFTLALLTCAKRGDEAADRHAAEFAAARGEPPRFRAHDHGLPLELTAEDAAFLHALDRRAARGFGAPAPTGRGDGG